MEAFFQSFYDDQMNHCYGCGQLNEHGHQLKSYWAGEATRAHFCPKPYHTAIPGFVYGGLIASLIDCHGTGSAAAAAYRLENRSFGSFPALRFVTAQLNVSYLQPTPLGVELTLVGTFEEVKAKKVVVLVDLLAEDQVTAKGRVVAVRISEGWGKP
jgi:acyl-coenzyme A thioesterase PaaI-like protein